MTRSEENLRRRIDTLTDERDKARAQVAELKRRNKMLQNRFGRLRASRNLWRQRYQDERWFNKSRRGRAA